MAISRPLLFALIAALALLAVVVSTRLMGGGKEQASSPTAAQTSATEPNAPSGQGPAT